LPEIAMKIFWIAVGLAITAGLLKFCLDVRAAWLARKEDLRLLRDLAERAAAGRPEPIAWESGDPSMASAEKQAARTEDRKAA
jgi:hypothetical protein